MRLVLLGDIQGNLPALEAVLADVRHRDADAVYHLGNVVGRGDQPEGVVQRLITDGILGVRGAQDQAFAEMFPDRLDPDQHRWLVRQPTTRMLSTGSMQVALYNATPVSLSDVPHSGQPDDYFREMASYVDARLHAFANSPEPFWRMVDGRWFVGAGSIGFPAGAEIPYAVVDVNGGAAVRIRTIDPVPARTR